MSSTVKKFNILIVDDTAKNIQVVANILNEQGYQMAFARNGKAALANVKTAKFDLILLDIMMPEMDGYETCQHLKNDPETKDIPVIFLTAKTDTESIIKAFEIGGVDYVTKPFNSAELLARVRTHLSLKRASEELKQSEHQLKDLNATKDKFFSIIAHDLKNPFSVLIGFSDILIDSEGLPDEEKEMVRDMNTASKHAYDLLQNLLKWSRSQVGHLQCQPEMIDIYHIVKNSMVLLGNNAKDKQIQLLSQIEENTLAYADMEMITTVIRNLINNAIKYTPEGGTITASAADKDGVWEISISDTGVGISPQDVQKLFRIDVKHSTPGTAAEQGTGLGLNLCKEFVEKNSGIIQVESEEGKGSRFYFTVPKSNI